jgi:hypothetical protein
MKNSIHLGRWRLVPISVRRREVTFRDNANQMSAIINDRKSTDFFL